MVNKYSQTHATPIAGNTAIAHDMPLAFDDVMLAARLGISVQTLWWLVVTNEKQYTYFRIPKSNGKWRRIHSPHDRMKHVQQNLMEEFLYCIPMGDHVGAYVPGRNCAHTARQHIKSGTIVSMDIENFFNSVKRCQVRHVFETYGYTEQVASLLAQLVCCQNFVPQGAPTSGCIANIVAQETFDKDIIAGLPDIKPGLRYTRYSDDIDVSHPEKLNYGEITKITELVTESLKKHGFKTNLTKTRVDHHTKRQIVLGMMVNSKLGIPAESYKLVDAIVDRCAKLGVPAAAASNNMTTHNFIQYVRGKLEFFKQVDPQHVERLCAKFAAAVAATPPEVLEVSFA